MSELVNILQHVIKFEDDKVNFIPDSKGNPWFNIRDVLRSLEYKDPKSAIKEIDKENKARVKNLNDGYKNIFGNNMHPDTIFVNEYGLYELLLKSKMKKAREFRRELVTKILPSIREFGYYEVSEKEKLRLNEVNRKLKKTIVELNKKNKTLQYNMKTKKYPPKSVVYIVRPKNGDKSLIKIGKTSNLEKRMKVINNSLPDHADVLYYIETDYINDLENLVKKHMKLYLYKVGKEYYKISIPRAKIIFNKCFKAIKNYGVDNVRSDKDKIKRLSQYVDIENEIKKEIIRQGLIEECDMVDDNIDSGNGNDAREYVNYDINDDSLYIEPDVLGSAQGGGDVYKIWLGLNEIEDDEFDYDNFDDFYHDSCNDVQDDEMNDQNIVNIYKIAKYKYKYYSLYASKILRHL